MNIYKAHENNLSKEPWLSNLDKQVEFQFAPKLS